MSQWFKVLLVLAMSAQIVPANAELNASEKSITPPQAVTPKSAESELAKLPVKRVICSKDIGSENAMTVTAVWQGKKDTYTGVPLRQFFKEMTSIPIETMANWKELSRYELVMEVVGKDTYPGLVSATELAMNKAGDKFVLFTKHDDQSGTDSVNLACKDDEYRVRWVRDIGYLRLVAVPKE